MHLAHICIWLCSWRILSVLTCCCAVKAFRCWSWAEFEFERGSKRIILKMDIFINEFYSRMTQSKTSQSGGSKTPFGWQVVRTNGVANQSWLNTFSGLGWKKQFDAKFKQSCLTSPSGQTKVKLNPTGGAGCKSVRRNLFQTFEHNCSADNLCFQTRCNRSQRLLSL